MVQSIANIDDPGLFGPRWRSSLRSNRREENAPAVEPYTIDHHRRFAGARDCRDCPSGSERRRPGDRSCRPDWRSGRPGGRQAAIASDQMRTRAVGRSVRAGLWSAGARPGKVSEGVAVARIPARIISAAQAADTLDFLWPATPKIIILNPWPPATAPERTMRCLLSTDLIEFRPNRISFRRKAVRQAHSGIRAEGTAV